VIPDGKKRTTIVAAHRGCRFYFNLQEKMKMVCAIEKMQPSGEFRVPGLGIVTGDDVGRALSRIHLTGEAARRVNEEISAYMLSEEPLSPEVQDFLALAVSRQVKKRKQASSNRG
jgi:hypothetical protein